MLPIADNPNSLAVPDSDVARLILGHDLHPNTKNRLRRNGKWPPAFYVAGRAYVLRSDIERFLAERRAAADEERKPRSEQARRAVATRWRRQREHEATALATEVRASKDVIHDGAEPFTTGADHV
jgi:hypothetical protein